MSQRLSGLLLGSLLLVLALPGAAFAGPATVTVRAEGDASTVLPRTTVTTTTTPVVKDGDPNHSCSGTAAIGALEKATGGDWSGPWFNGIGYGLNVIKGESHTFANGDYWGFWINNRYSTTGLCDTELQEGDSLLYFVDSCNDIGPAPNYDCLDARLPTSLTAPTGAAKGTPFTVHVDRYDRNGTASPLGGALVTGMGVSATTDGSGNAAVSVDAAGPVELKASKTGYVRSEGRTVCVHDGDDGTCGTTKPGEPAPAADTTPGAQCATTGDDGRCGTTDKRPSQGRITFAKEGQRFARKRGPRTLAGTASPDPSGIRSVRLRLTWRDGKRCSTYDGTKELLVKPKRCGASQGKWFSAGDRQDWSYLLPAPLGSGRWVLDVEVTDGAGNVDRTLQRGRNRVVFHVG